MNSPLTDKNAGVETEAGGMPPNDGTTYAVPLRRGVALTFDVLLLVFSLWLLGMVLPSFWLGGLADQYGKASALQMVRVLMWVVAIIGVWLLFALVLNSARQKTLSMRLLLVRPVAGRDSRTGFGNAIIRSGISVFNKLPLVAVIVVIGSIPLTTFGDYVRRATVSNAISATEPIRAEIAKHGCQAGSRPAPSKDIAAVDVTNAGPERCMITITFTGLTYRTAALSDEKIKLTSDQHGPWICSSDISPKWLPQDCR